MLDSCNRPRLCYQNMAHVLASDIVLRDCKYGDKCAYAGEHMSEISQFREEWLINIDKILGSFKHEKKADILQRAKYLVDDLNKNTKKG